MLLCFDVARAVIGAIAATLVIGGVVTKNSFEQLGVPNHPVGKPTGMALFIVGWLLAAYILSSGRTTTLAKAAVVLSCLGILGSVLRMKAVMSKGGKPNMIFPLIFALSWVVLSVLSAQGLPLWGQAAGVAAAALVLGSMMGLLPKQRKHAVVDGPGMPMFTGAWVIVVALNALKR